MFHLRIKQDDKDTIISNLMEENKKLKTENNAYARQIDNIMKAGDAYEEIMDHIINLKKQYEDKLHKLDQLTDDYEKQLKIITDNVQKDLKKRKESR